jgi:hypothetical protein
MESKFIQVIRLKESGTLQIKDASAIIDKQAINHPISVVNWKSYPYSPEVSFRIAHTGSHIILKFNVREKAVRAAETRINGEVYKDSCVEFFVSVDGKHYYNFEFSCIGTPHVAYGEGRHNRQYLPEEVIRQITIASSLGDQPFETKTGDFAWELTAIIPVTTFIHNPEIRLKQLMATANFYKCGDELPEPHFVTWNPVGTEQPDYHRPEYFGKLIFE